MFLEALFDTKNPLGLISILTLIQEDFFISLNKIYYRLELS